MTKLVKNLIIGGSGTVTVAGAGTGIGVAVSNKKHNDDVAVKQQQAKQVAEQHAKEVAEQQAKQVAEQHAKEVAEQHAKELSLIIAELKSDREFKKEITLNEQQKEVLAEIAKEDKFDAFTQISSNLLAKLIRDQAIEQAKYDKQFNKAIALNEQQNEVLAEIAKEDKFDEFTQISSNLLASYIKEQAKYNKQFNKAISLNELQNEVLAKVAKEDAEDAAFAAWNQERQALQMAWNAEVEAARSFELKSDEEVAKMSDKKFSAYINNVLHKEQPEELHSVVNFEVKNGKVTYIDSKNNVCAYNSVEEAISAIMLDSSKLVKAWWAETAHALQVYEIAFAARNFQIKSDEEVANMTDEEFNDYITKVTYSEQQDAIFSPTGFSIENGVIKFVANDGGVSYYATLEEAIADVMTHHGQRAVPAWWSRTQHALEVRDAANFAAFVKVSNELAHERAEAAFAAWNQERQALQMAWNAEVDAARSFELKSDEEVAKMSDKKFSAYINNVLHKEQPEELHSVVNFEVKNGKVTYIDSKNNVCAYNSVEEAISAIMLDSNKLVKAWWAETAHALQVYEIAFAARNFQIKSDEEVANMTDEEFNDYITKVTYSEQQDAIFSPTGFSIENGVIKFVANDGGVSNYVTLEEAIADVMTHHNHRAVPAWWSRTQHALEVRDAANFAAWNHERQALQTRWNAEIKSAINFAIQSDEEVAKMTDAEFTSYINNVLHKEQPEELHSVVNFTVNNGKVTYIDSRNEVCEFNNVQDAISAIMLDSNKQVKAWWAETANAFKIYEVANTARNFKLATNEEIAKMTDAEFNDYITKVTYSEQPDAIFSPTGFSIENGVIKFVTNDGAVINYSTLAEAVADIMTHHGQRSIPSWWSRTQHALEIRLITSMSDVDFNEYISIILHSDQPDAATSPVKFEVHNDVITYTTNSGVDIEFRTFMSAMKAVFLKGDQYPTVPTWWKNTEEALEIYFEHEMNIVRSNQEIYYREHSKEITKLEIVISTWSLIKNMSEADREAKITSIIDSIKNGKISILEAQEAYNPSSFNN